MVPTKAKVQSAQHEPLLAPCSKWIWIIGLVLSLIGVGLAGYLTYEHYTSSTSLNCPAGGGIVDCLKVTTSQYASISGVPIALLGLVFFLVMVTFHTRRAWASTSTAIRGVRVLWSIVGVGTAMWLAYAEFFKLHAICLWCTCVHVVSVLLFIVAAFGTAATGVLDAADSA